MATMNAAGTGIPKLGGATLPGLTPIRISGNNLPTGDNDLYTVPTGKKTAFVLNGRSYQASGGNIVYYPEFKVSGTYYRLSSDTTVTTGNAGVVTIPSIIVLNAGEIFAINTATNSGLNCIFQAYEMDAGANLYTARNLALSNGNNTLYTVPAGKTANGAGFTANTNSNVTVVNTTGGALNYIIYVVNSGGSVASTNQISASTSVNNNTHNAFIVNTALDTGDFIVVNTSAGTAGQIAYFTYFEV